MATLAQATGTGSARFRSAPRPVASRTAAKAAFHARMPRLTGSRCAVKVSSTLVFDLGVFFLVVGAAALLLIALGHQSTRAHRTARR